MPIRLSKSRLLAYRQCERRLWLELHPPELRQDNDASLAAFSVGHEVGDLARRQALLSTSQPIFEAGFAGAGALAFADILLPVRRQRQRRWRMVEVKSSTSVKDCQRDDAPIQSYVAMAAGVPFAGVAVAHIDSNWVYPGAGDYRGLLVEEDLTEGAFARGGEVKEWVAGSVRWLRFFTAKQAWLLSKF